MVQIVENLLEPIKLPTDDDSLTPGDIVSLHYNDDGVTCILSTNNNPFGIVVKSRDEFGLVSILHSMAILKIYNYDLSNEYKAGDLLYSNDYGRLTNEKCEENSLLLGHVLLPPSVSDLEMEINWI